MREPTAEECSANAKIEEGYACWYPQVAGYTARALVVPAGGCFDVYVWHDGEFPLAEDSKVKPAELHHCMPQQFIDFGEWVSTLPGMSDE